MKRISKCILLVVFSILTTSAFSQGVNFQGVARSANGTILASSNISLKLSIISKNVDATPEYVETKTVVTNAQGIFSVVVGDATNALVTGSFKNIMWSDGIKFLKVEMDPAAGTNYINMGAIQLQYVPYSFYSLGVDAANVNGVLPIEKGGTGVGSLVALKSALTLNNVNNTADLSKPISTLTQTALNLKLNAADTSKFTKQLYTDSALLTKVTQTSIDLKLNASDTSKYTKQTYIDSALITKLVSKDTLNLSKRINSKISPSDSVLFQNDIKINGHNFGRGSGNLINNIAIGDSSLNFNKTGYSNVAIGVNALKNTTIGSANTSVGYGSMFGNTTGSQNSAFGLRALSQNTIGIDNVGVGWQSMSANSVGKNNTAIGSNSMNGNTTGNNNTALGKNSLSNSNFNNTTGVGYNAQVSADNQIQLGDENVTDVKTSGNITAKKYTTLVANAYNFSTGTNNVDLSLSNIYTINLSGNNILTFSNGTPGTYIIKLIQDGTGSRTVTFPVSNWKWAGGSLPTLSRTANTTDIVSLIFDGTTYFAKIDKGFDIGNYIDQNVSTTVTLSGKITKDTTLFAKDINYLSGIVYITKGVTLTIQEGAKVQSKIGANVAALVICRGAKIIAKGTAEKPIIFTSASVSPQSGDWGGIVLLGTAKVNQSLTWKGTSYTGLTSVEGGVNDTQVGYGLAGSGDASFPTGNDADNSGILQYVRIEYAGYAYQPDNEMNSLTMACVGNATTIDHIQVTYAKDDAFEWFGGTVNCKYLIAYKTQDDDFDTDFGYTGNVQFGIALRDSVIADISKSHAFESDNDGRGSDYAPKTTAVFSNITAIGPRIHPTFAKGNSLFYAGAQIRRNSGISIQNSIIAGWPIGITIDESSVITNGATYKNLEDGIIRLNNLTLAGNTIDLLYVGKSGASTNKTDADVLGIFSTPSYGNTILNSANPDVLKLTQPFNYSNPDFTPYANNSTPSGSVSTDVLTGGSSPWGTLGIWDHVNFTKNGAFTDSKLQNEFFEKVTFRGAVATSGANQSWWKGWTVWR
jgi:hypothetical protein